jgi:hypothetical protein
LRRRWLIRSPPPGLTPGGNPRLAQCVSRTGSAAPGTGDEPGLRTFRACRDKANPIWSAIRLMDPISAIQSPDVHGEHSSVPRIRIQRYRAIGKLGRDTPASGSVTTRKYIPLDLVDVIAARLARADRGLNLADQVDIDHGLLCGLADTEHDHRVKGCARRLSTKIVGNSHYKRHEPRGKRREPRG